MGAEAVNYELQKSVRLGMAQIAYILEVTGLSLVIVVVELGSWFTAKDAWTSPYLAPTEEVGSVLPSRFDSLCIVGCVAERPLLCPSLILVVELALWAIWL